MLQLPNNSLVKDQQTKLSVKTLPAQFLLPVATG